MTDYKQLCVELIDELEGWVAYGDEIDIANAHVLIDRARAALAEPKPEGPTDEQLDELFVEIDQTGSPKSWRIYARTVLTNWGKSPLH